MTVVHYSDRYRQAFYDLNAAWLSGLFGGLEPADIGCMENPGEYFVATGGEVYFLLEDQRPVATAALKALGEGRYELCKMAVDDACQGRGLGRQLLSYIIADAQKRGFGTLFLQSNRKLAPALKLYQSLGFREVPLLHSQYARTDIAMELVLPTPLRACS